MGYTHYWGRETSETTQEQYASAIKDIRAVVSEFSSILADSAGDAGTSPELEIGVVFNGIENNGHETFYLPENIEQMESFEFCKTAYKPYDIVVVACLTILHNHCPRLKISSDGEGSDLEEGLKLAQNTLKNASLVRMDLPVPTLKLVK